MTATVHAYVKEYRAKLDAPDILEGDNLYDVAQEFWRETEGGDELGEAIERLPGPLGQQWETLWRTNYAGKNSDASDSVEEKQATLDEMKRVADAFLAAAGSRGGRKPKTRKGKGKGKSRRARYSRRR
jgi:hypothetical protein